MAEACRNPKLTEKKIRKGDDNRCKEKQKGEKGEKVMQ